jgi:hypothetical protein
VERIVGEKEWEQSGKRISRRVLASVAGNTSPFFLGGFLRVVSSFFPCDTRGRPTDQTFTDSTDLFFFYFFFLLVEEKRKLINKKWKRWKNITCGRTGCTCKCVAKVCEWRGTNEPNPGRFLSNLIQFEIPANKNGLTISMAFPWKLSSAFRSSSITSEERNRNSPTRKKNRANLIVSHPSAQFPLGVYLFVFLLLFLFVFVFLGVAEVEEEEEEKRFVFLSFPPFFVSFSRRYLTVVEIKNPKKRKRKKGRKFRPGRNKKHTHKTPNISDSITTAMS